MTNTNSKQELLPPISKEPVGLSGWLEWLITPLPGQIMLPATGFLIMGLDWLFFSKEAATLGLALPFTITVGFLAGSIGTFHLQRKYAQDSKAVGIAQGPGRRRFGGSAVSPRGDAGRCVDHR